MKKEKEKLIFFYIKSFLKYFIGAFPSKVLKILVFSN